MEFLQTADNKSSHLIRKMEGLGYKVESNGKRGKGYRIIITEKPQTEFNQFLMDNCVRVNKPMGDKIAHLLTTLGTEKGFSFRTLEHYNYITDKTIQKYL